MRLLRLGLICVSYPFSRGEKIPVGIGDGRLTIVGMLAIVFNSKSIDLWPMNLASRRSVEFPLPNMENRQLTPGNCWLYPTHKGIVGRADADEIGNDVVSKAVKNQGN